MELRLDAAAWRARPGMAALLDALGAGEGLTRYVGGAVRDELLGLPVNDIDLATRLRPDAVAERLQTAGIKAIPTGIDHGTITAVSKGQIVEVTTLRRDVSTDGRRATVAFTDDWQEDAARRDFTINALFADPVSGEVQDYFGGRDDLKARRVRFIGDPNQRIAEDHLRILRFFRFHARFGTGEPEAAGLDACTRRAKDLMALSRERIADELLKLLGVPDPSPTVAIMLQREILAPVLPEITPDRLRNLKVLVSAERAAGTEPDPLRRLSALLPADPLVAEKIAARLRLSNRARKRLAAAADRSLASSPQALVYLTGSETAADRLLLAGRPDDAIAVADWPVPRLPIGGGALIARGLAPGPAVARTLKQIEQKWLEAGFPEGEQFDRIVADAVRSAP
ncbi:MAG TPA: CCA tRNA nucleotidyltransferase [Sphingomicrobium sp.]|nr:CCA tRNA nucleotidyltransferase [Sphingomicrobium sp.]